MKLKDFLKHCHAYGGNWVNMLLSGIQEINPQTYEKIKNKTLDLNQVFKILRKLGVEI